MGIPLLFQPCSQRIFLICKRGSLHLVVELSCFPWGPRERAWPLGANCLPLRMPLIQSSAEPLGKSASDILCLVRSYPLSPCATMEEVRKTTVQRQSPIKTEWNSRCVLFTYFQGDISSVVDEHFSRALGTVRSPQGLSPSGRSGDVILRNGEHVTREGLEFSIRPSRKDPFSCPRSS